MGEEVMAQGRAEFQSSTRKIPGRPPGSCVADAAPEGGPAPALPPPPSPKLGCAPQSRSVHLPCPCLSAGGRFSLYHTSGTPSLTPAPSVFKDAALVDARVTQGGGQDGQRAMWESYWNGGSGRGFVNVEEQKLACIQFL